MIQELCERLVADYGLVHQGAYLRKGRCPECGRKGLWTETARPFVLFCPRRNHCRARIDARALYPELFNQFAQAYPATRERPNATAAGYLASRGLDTGPLERAGVFVQGSRAVEVEPGKWVEFPTAKFPLEGGAACHRLIDYSGGDKNRFEGTYKGRVWAMPGFEAAGEVWISEAIIDALSLIQAGRSAVSAISAQHVPADWLDGLRPGAVRLVIAFDNDRAGREGAAKLAAACRARRIECRLAFPPPGRDWNDLLLHGELGAEAAAETLETALWRGALAEAESAEAYFAVWRTRRAAQLFEYDGGYWRGRVVKEGEAEVRRLSDFTVEPLLALKRRVGPGRFEHALRVTVHGRKSSQEVVLEGRHMTAQKDFKAALWTAAMVNWKGRQDDLDLLIDHVQARCPTVVQEVGVVGYEPDSGSYLFPDGGYGPDGRRYHPDANGFINVAGRLFCLNASEDEKAIPPEPGLAMAELLGLLRAAYGDVALAALGFYAAALFAEQFSARPTSRFFPFLSLVGPPGTGKSGLIDILNRMLGRAVDEGLSVEEVDTAKGTTRLMASVSNLPIAILEMDKAKAKRFNLNRLLTLFNRAPLQTRANRSNDLTVNTLRFRGALVFAQNVEQFAGEAQKGRVVSLAFTKQGQDPDTLAALLQIQGLPPGQLAAFRHEVLTRRVRFQQTLFERYRSGAEFLVAEGVKNTRVANNHAVVLAGCKAVFEAFLPPGDAQERSNDLAAFLLERARAKVASLAEDSDYLSLFFDTIGRLLARSRIANHCTHSSEVWLNMGEVKEVFDTEHISFHFTKLFEEFETSPHVRFRNTPRHSPVARKTMRLYGFDRAVLNL
jgi:hypothetical protein